MAAPLGEVYIDVRAKMGTLDADLQKAERTAQKFGTTATKAVNLPAKAADNLGTAMHRAGKATTATGAVIAKAGKTAQQSLDRASKAGTALGNAMRFIATAVTIRAVSGAIDQYTQLENRLKLVTGSQEQLNYAMSDVVKIAQSTYAELGATGAIYQRVAQNANSLGLNLGEVGSVVETVNQAVALSGTGAEAASAGLYQFGQALASGTLRGDEFRSVMEQLPGLARVIADGLDVPIGSLREMAAQGQLTAKEVIKAIQSQEAAVNASFGSMTVTIGQALQLVRTNITAYLGETAKTTGANQLLAQGILLVANNMHILIPAIGLVVAGFIGMQVLSVVATIINTVTVAVRALTVAMTILTANPLVLLGTALASIVAYFILTNENVQKTIAEFVGLGGAAEEAGAKVGAAAEGMGKAISGSIAAGVKDANLALSSLPGEASRAASGVSSAMQGAGDGISRPIRAGVDRGKSSLTELGSHTGTVVSAMNSQLSTLASSISAPILAGVQAAADALQNLASVASSVASQIASSMSRAGSAASGAGGGGSSGGGSSTSGNQYTSTNFNPLFAGKASANRLTIAAGNLTQGLSTQAFQPILEQIQSQRLKVVMDELRLEVKDWLQSASLKAASSLGNLTKSKFDLIASDPIGYIISQVPPRSYGDIARLADVISKSKLGSGILTTAFGSKIGPALVESDLQGFKTGGSGMVRGTTAPDGNVIAFRADRGERVDIQTRRQQRNGRGGDVIVKMDIHTPDANSFRRSEDQIILALKNKLDRVGARD